jgi:YidC/Oxa1 family membrane protein insertase
MDKRSLIFVVALTAALFFVNQWFSSSNPPPAPPATPPTQQARVEEQIARELETRPTASVPKFSNEEYFVLENAYQQVVFSNVGGAIAEINLPFQSKENTQSFVRPIHIDRVFREDYQINDHFPAFPYYINNGNGVQKISDLSLGGYYPLLRRTLINPRDPLSFRSPVQHYALRVSGDNDDTDKKIYTLKRLEQDLIEFELIESDRKITKIFTFPKNPDEAPYVLEATIKVDGNGRGLWVATGVPEVELISDSPAPALTYRYTKANHKGSVESLSLPKECAVSTSVYPDWICSANGFFGLILDPLNEIPPGYRACKVPGTVDPSRLTLIDPEYRPYPPEKYPGYDFQLPLRTQTTAFRYYAGPLEGDILKRVDATFADPAAGYTPDYIGALSFHGWFTFISEPFAKFLFILM